MPTKRNASMPTKKKGSIILYATEEERERIKKAAAQLHQSMSTFILDCVMEQVVSVEEIIKKNEV